MKPAPFAYFAPASLDEALALLAEHGYDAKLLAGGQSLIPTMNFRLSQPAVLIDLNRVAELAYLQADSAGGLRIGAMTRQRTLERSALVAERAPLLHATMPHIAHVQIRNRGTLGGSLAHADPAAELPAVAVALDALLHVRNQHGVRTVSAADFYVGLFTTDLAPDELLAEIVLPPLPARSGWAFHEIARRAGDYAMCGCAATVTLDENGRCSDARLVYLSVGDGPVQAQQAMNSLIGEVLTTQRIADAAQLAGQKDIDPTADIHASVAYRRHLAAVLARRALTDANARASETLEQHRS
jgi:carbon-monoxide dehydrogenase medium subunit